MYDYLGLSDKIGIRTRDGGHFMATDDVTSLIEYCDYNFRGIEAEKDFKTVPYTPDPSWDTIRAPGSPDQVSGLRSVKNIEQGI